MKFGKEAVPMLFAALAALLPGDRINDVAPISSKKNDDEPQAMVDAFDAAEAKRRRKAAKRKARP